MIARLTWKQVQSEVNNNAFRQDPSAEHLNPAALQKLLSTSFGAGPPTNVQFMIKDSRKYASTGGWAFFRSTNGSLTTLYRAAASRVTPQKELPTLFSPVIRLDVERRGPGCPAKPIYRDDKVLRSRAGCFARARQRARENASHRGFEQQRSKAHGPSDQIRYALTGAWRPRCLRLAVERRVSIRCCTRTVQVNRGPTTRDLITRVQSSGSQRRATSRRLRSSRSAPAEAAFDPIGPSPDARGRSFRLCPEKS